jgi:hypothetical protein
MKMKWTGNITIKVEDKEDTYPLTLLMLSGILIKAYR